VAEGRRRAGDADNERRDEGLDNDALEADEVLAADDELDSDVADDELDDDALDPDDELDGDATNEATTGRRAGGTATKARPKSPAPAGRKSTKGKADRRPGIFARFVNFFREVVAELRKVIWPTRKELLTYTAVVVVFVTIMLTVVGLLDYGFAKAVLWVFGSKTAPDAG
jgi:preprotein translocase subunit SecE